MKLALETGTKYPFRTFRCYRTQDVSNGALMYNYAHCDRLFALLGKGSWLVAWKSAGGGAVQRPIGEEGWR